MIHDKLEKGKLIKLKCSLYSLLNLIEPKDLTSDEVDIMYALSKDDDIQRKFRS